MGHGAGQQSAAIFAGPASLTVTSSLWPAFFSFAVLLPHENLTVLPSFTFRVVRTPLMCSTVPCLPDFFCSHFSIATSRWTEPLGPGTTRTLTTCSLVPRETIGPDISAH